VVIEWLLEVWDTGAGIPENAREEIFEEYIQLENPERDRAKGLGLGLAICRRLAGLLGASLGVRSRPGHGSVFWITLPLEHPARHGPGVGANRLAESAEDVARLGGTVLVVDGDPLVRAGMETAITGWGAKVILAASRDEAVTRCCEGGAVPDMAICNLRLPGKVSGIDFGGELRNLYPGIGVLLVSADISEATQARRAPRTSRCSSSRSRPAACARRCAPCCRSGLACRQSQTAAEFQRQPGLVHAVKMQTRRAALDQALAQLGDDVEAEGADRVGIVAEAFELAPHPARNLGAAGVGKARQLGKAGDRHDAGDDGDRDAERARLGDEVLVGVGVVEILGDRRVRAGIDLALEVQQVLARAPGLRVPFRDRPRPRCGSGRRFRRG
jgi:CheY-like chemotaxis protein